MSTSGQLDVKRVSRKQQKTRMETPTSSQRRKEVVELALSSISVFSAPNNHHSNSTTPSNARYKQVQIRETGFTPRDIKLGKNLFRVEIQTAGQVVIFKFQEGQGQSPSASIDERKTL